MKYRLFIASSVKGLDVAYAIQEGLEYHFEPTVWPQGVFEVSRTTIESLFEVADQCDAAVFVFTPDDELIIRGKTARKARDNVVFELGLFLGKLGRDRCFIVAPRESDLDLPTDLAGVTPATYDADRNDGNLLAAVGPACTKIRRAIMPGSTARPKEPQQQATLEEVLVSKPFSLLFNPAYGRSKRMLFARDGLITEGNNKNEHGWRINNGALEILNLGGQIYSRFRYEPAEGVFRHTNDPDTLSIRDQVLSPER
jgi:hypothetical protein